MLSNKKLLKSNVIILTTGISGSSLITHLIAQAGYWPGDNTITKNNNAGRYNTFENSDLVGLNEQLFEEVELKFNSNEFYGDKYHELFTRSIHLIDPNPYTDFIDKCELHTPWVWKDPRLRVTLPFWLSKLDLTDCKFIIVYRNIWSLWVSLLNKRQIVSFFQLKSEEAKTIQSLQVLINSRNLPVHMICYDELINEPEEHIENINTFLSVKLSNDDFTKVIDLKLINKSKSIIRQIKAVLIYIKNYFQMCSKS